jgi:serine/threonine protein kinase
MGLTYSLKGHRWLYEKLDLLHRDISLGNLMISQDKTRGFLTDLDLAINVRRAEASGAPAKTGTRPFMAIQLLVGAPHNYLHDLESFFWVLFWMAVHHNGPGQQLSQHDTYTRWATEPASKVAMIKAGLVSDDAIYANDLKRDCTAYCEPLIPVLHKLRLAMFSGSQLTTSDGAILYERMSRIVCDASVEVSGAGQS